jgi:hypothetical protein
VNIRDAARVLADEIAYYEGKLDKHGTEGHAAFHAMRKIDAYECVLDALENEYPDDVRDARTSAEHNKPKDR